MKSTKKLFSALLIPSSLAAVISLSVAAPPLAPAHAAQRAVPSNGVVVQVKPGTDPAALARDYGATVVSSVPSASLYSLYPSPSTYPAPPPVLPNLSKDPRVTWVERDQYLAVQIHIGFDGGKGGLIQSNGAAYAALRLNEAQRFADGHGVRVAVLDTGVSPTHPELEGHLTEGFNALDPGKAPLDLEDGAFNAAAGHGTMVAGLIARVAPKAEIIPIRVMNGDGVGSLLGVVRGVQYALSQKAQVLNISFGTPIESSILDRALDQADNAGAIVVAAAGNQGLGIHRYPASSGGCIGVASTDANLHKSLFSNFGSDIAVVAPGSDIQAPYLHESYAAWSGTSVSTAFVSGAAALVWSAQPEWKGEDVAARLRETARSIDAINPKYRHLLGNGIVDLAAAVGPKGK